MERAGVFAGFFELESIRDHTAAIESELESQGLLPTKYLFLHPDSHRLYQEAVHDRNYTLARDSFDTFTKSLPSLVQHLVSKLKSSVYTIVSLGVGSGEKEKRLVAELLRQHRSSEIQLIFLDINYNMIQNACNNIEYIFRSSSRVQVAYCHADFERLRYYNKLFPAADRGPVIFLLLGGTFGNQQEKPLLSSLREVATENTYLLTGVGGLSDSDHSLGGYSTSTAFEFLGLTLNRFDSVDNHDRNWKVEIIDSETSDVPETITITVKADSKRFGRVSLGFSRRYQLATLKDFFESQGCAIEWFYEDPTDQYCKFLLKLSGAHRGRRGALKATS